MSGVVILLCSPNIAFNQSVAPFTVHCLSVCLSFYYSVCLCQFLCPSFRQSACSPIRQLVYTSGAVSIFVLTFNQSIQCLSQPLSAYLYSFLSVNVTQSVCLLKVVILLCVPNIAFNQSIEPLSS